MASRGGGRNGINDAQAPVVGRTEVGPSLRGLLCLVALCLPTIGRVNPNFSADDWPLANNLF